MTDLIPITVFAAIILFFIKECINVYANYRAKKRKIAAYKILLADEIEQNNWVVKSLRHTLESIKDNWETAEVTIEPGMAGYDRIKFASNLGDMSWPLVKPSSEIFEKLFTEIAVVEAKYFAIAKDAYEGVSELRHIRDGIIEYVQNRADYPEPHMEQFIEYAFERVADSYISMSTLYKICTSQELKDFKISSFTSGT